MPLLTFFRFGASSALIDEPTTRRHFPVLYPTKVVTKNFYGPPMSRIFVPSPLKEQFNTVNGFIEFGCHFQKRLPGAFPGIARAPDPQKKIDVLRHCCWGELAHASIGVRRLDTHT